MSNSKIKFNLLSFVEAIEKIEEYSQEFKSAEDFYHDSKSFDASMMQFVVIGELILRLDEDFKMSHSNIPWQQISSKYRVMQEVY